MSDSEPVAQKQAEAQQRHDEAVAFSRDMERHWLALGRLLVQINEEESYKLLGYSSFLDYINASGYAMRGRMAYNLMRLARYPFIEDIKHLPRTVCLQLEKIRDREELLQMLARLDKLSEKDRWLELGRHDDRHKHRQRLIERKELLLDELRKVLNELAALEAEAEE